MRDKNIELKTEVGDRTGTRLWVGRLLRSSSRNTCTGIAIDDSYRNIGI